MTCERFDLPGGGYAIVCSRGRKPRAKCSACNVRVHELLCDFPLSGKKAGKTCSRKLCSACAVKVGELDYCPPHAKVEPKQRVFDHLVGAPEDARFSKAARAMKSSPWWSSVPERDEPAATAGEVSR